MAESLFFELSPEPAIQYRLNRAVSSLPFVSLISVILALV